MGTVNSNNVNLFDQAANFLFQRELDKTASAIDTLEGNVDMLETMNSVYKEQIAEKMPDTNSLAIRPNFCASPDVDKLKMFRAKDASAAKVREAITNIYKSNLYENAKTLNVMTQYLTERNQVSCSPEGAVPVFENYEKLNSMLFDKSVLQTLEANLIGEQMFLLAELKYLSNTK